MDKHWVGITISGVRPKGWATYGTWGVVPELPQIERFGWVPEISENDRNRLSSREIVEKYSEEIERVIRSPSACYIGTKEEGIDASSKIQPFYHDQQGCVDWATDGTDDDSEVVTYHIDDSTQNTHIGLRTGHTIDSFLWRWYLESQAWHKHRSGWCGEETGKSTIEFNDDDSPMDRKLKEYTKKMRDMYMAEVE